MTITIFSEGKFACVQLLSWIKRRILDILFKWVKKELLDIINQVIFK